MIMTYQGTVKNGVILVEGGATLPEGTVVTVIPVSKEVQESPADDTRTIGQKLADLARKYENLPCDLPEDLAINHDHYLHGLPKRQ